MVIFSGFYYRFSVLQGKFSFFNKKKWKIIYKEGEHKALNSGVS